MHTFFGAPTILKKKGGFAQTIQKNEDPQKRIFQPFRNQQNAFCNFIFEMKRTFSKDPEHPKIPRPGILSDLCLNFTVISVWILSESLSELLSEFLVRIFVWIFVRFFLCLNFCLNFCLWIFVSEFLSLNFRLWIFVLNFCVWIFVWIFVSDFLSECC